MKNSIKEAREKLEAIISKNASKYLLNYGELRELTTTQNELLIAISKHIEA